MNRPPRPRRPRSLAIAIVAALLLTVGVASAGAASNIEGVWSFNGGAIDVKPLSNGTYEGIVSQPTTFAECPHEVNEPIWTEIKEQSDGSYCGKHQWFYGTPQTGCHRESRGPTAWRVITEPNGSYYLYVCFSHPGTTQPHIAANGDPQTSSEYKAYGVTYGCYRSELIALLPPAPGSVGASGSSGSSGTSTTGKGGVLGEKETLTLPSNKLCLSARRFKIHLLEPKYDPFKSVTIVLNGHKVKSSRKGDYVVATIDLRGLRKGAFTIHVSVVTILGHHLSGRRTYHTCIPKRKTKRFEKPKVL
jgi:hypothetical protein